MLSETAARRALLGALVGGGVSMTAAPAHAAPANPWSPRELPAKTLRVGDLIVGADATVVRVASNRAVSSGRRIRVTDPRTGAAVPLGPGREATSVPANRPFVVLARRISVAAVRVSSVGPGSATVIDGGSP